MKQYKLIKEYPGSPCLNSLRTVETYDDRVVTVNTAELYHLYPEFWKEVKAKDYEIISFKNKNKPYNIYTLQEDGKYHGLSGCAIKFEHCIKNYDIYTVKSCITGDTFTIGDRVISSLTSPTIPDSILSFGNCFSDAFECDTAFATFKQLSNSGLSIRYLQPVLPIFRTFDEVDIFNGDKVWGVLPGLWLLCSWDKFKEKYISSDKKYFSTEKAAREYINLNKPKFSSQELLDLANTFSNSYLVKKKIMELASSK